MASGVPRGIVTTRRRDEGTGLWRLSRRLLRRDWPVAYLFAAPLLILLFGLIGRPLYNAFVISLHEPYGTDFVGLRTYNYTWRRAWGAWKTAARNGAARLQMRVQNS
jgi:hypothetical protein